MGDSNQLAVIGEADHLPIITEAESGGGIFGFVRDHVENHLAKRAKQKEAEGEYYHKYKSDYQSSISPKRPIPIAELDGKMSELSKTKGYFSDMLEGPDAYKFLFHTMGERRHNGSYDSMPEYLEKMLAEVFLEKVTKNDIKSAFSFLEKKNVDGYSFDEAELQKDINIFMGFISLIKYVDSYYSRSESGNAHAFLCMVDDDTLAHYSSPDYGNHIIKKDRNPYGLMYSKIKQIL